MPIAVVTIIPVSAWENFRYLETALAELLEVRRGFTYSYDEARREMKSYTIRTSHHHSPVPIPDVLIAYTREQIYYLLLQIIPEFQINTITGATIKKIKLNLSGSYDIEIEFASTTTIWPVIFYFDRNYILRDLARPYQYKAIPIPPKYNTLNKVVLPRFKFGK